MSVKHGDRAMPKNGIQTDADSIPTSPQNRLWEFGRFRDPLTVGRFLESRPLHEA
jgi:hypothetical protein